MAKFDPRVALLGDVDELNSVLGLLLTEPLPDDVRALAPDHAVDLLVVREGDQGYVAATLSLAQHDLFDLGGALCFPGAPVLKEAHVARIDAAALSLNAGLPPLKEFVLPGGSPLIAQLHLARTVCRRVERAATAFFAAEAGGENAIAYLNRLSDYLFIATRFEARRTGVPEALWEKAKSVGG